jgi:hypothetical protein
MGKGVPMYVPEERQHVQVTGRTGTFIVLTVNHDTERADLVSLTGVPFLLDDVPLSSIHLARWD